MDAQKDKKKKLKKLNKTLRQIHDIAAKLANGEDLTDDQQKKMDKKQEIEQQIKDLSLWQEKEQTDVKTSGFCARDRNKHYVCNEY